jgi:predicted HTH transcriptional regulator
MARTFFELGLIERWGSGIRRMIKACEEAGLAPPSFEEIGARIRVTFFLEKKTAPVPDVTDNKLIQALSENINTTHSISKAVGLSTRTTRSRLLRLVNLGLIAEVSKNSNDPKKSYQLIENPKSGLQGDSVPPILLV